MFHELVELEGPCLLRLFDLNFKQDGRHERQAEEPSAEGFIYSTKMFKPTESCSGMKACGSWTPGVPGRTMVSAHCLHLVHEATWQQGQQLSVLKPVPAVLLKWAGLVGRHSLDKTRVHVGLRTEKTKGHQI